MPRKPPKKLERRLEVAEERKSRLIGFFTGIQREFPSVDEIQNHIKIIGNALVQKGPVDWLKVNSSIERVIKFEKENKKLDGLVEKYANSEIRAGRLTPLELSTLKEGMQDVMGIRKEVEELLRQVRARKQIDQN